MAAAMVVSGSHEMLHSPVIAVCKSLFAVFAFHGIGIAPDADLSLILVVYHQQFTRPLHDLAASDHSVTADKAPVPCLRDPRRSLFWRLLPHKIHDSRLHQNLQA